MKDEPEMIPFRRGKCKVWWVVSSEVDIVPLPKGIIQNTKRGRVRVRNYLVSTGDWICELLELAFLEGGSVGAAKLVL